MFVGHWLKCFKCNGGIQIWTIARNAFVTGTFQWRGYERRTIPILLYKIWQISHLYELVKNLLTDIIRLLASCCPELECGKSANLLPNLQTTNCCKGSTTFPNCWIYKNVLHLTRQNLPLKRFLRTPNALLMQDKKMGTTEKDSLETVCSRLWNSFPLLTALIFHWDGPNSCRNCAF